MKKWLWRGLILLLFAVFFFSAWNLADYFLQSQKQQQQFDELLQIVEQSKLSVTEPIATTPPPTTPATPEETVPEETEPSTLPEYAELSALNPHLVGWLQIEGTRINYPVMQNPNTVDYYLRRDFYGNYSSHGCLYAREQCDVTAPSDNITIYGHNMKDGSMFADLLNLRSKSYWQNHRYIQFDTLTEHHTYEIFAVVITTANKVTGFGYHKFIDAATAEEYQEFIEDCKSLSLYDTGITPVYGEKLITLSTCEYSRENGRLAVIARRVD